MILPQQHHKNLLEKCMAVDDLLAKVTQQPIIAIVG
jgi:hypothetical protein